MWKFSIFREIDILMRKLLATIALIALVLTACSKKEFIDKPLVNVKQADWQSVPAAGGTIEYNNMVLEFPAGVFGGGAGRVAVSTVPKGKVEDFKEYQISEFYQVVVPSTGTEKPFKVSFQYDGGAENVSLLEISPKWAKNRNVLFMGGTPLPTSFKDGIATAEFPAISPTEGDDQHFMIGLIEDIAASYLPSSKAYMGIEKRAGKETPATPVTIHYSVTWAAPDVSDRKEIMEQIDAAILEVAKIYVDLGIEIPTSVIKYKVTTDFTDEFMWGEQVSSKLSKSLGTIHLNSKRFNNLIIKSRPQPHLLNELKQTLVHETLHQIQEEIYDTRWASTITLGGWFGTEASGQWQMFSEALATWIEQFTGDMIMGDNAPNKGNIRRFFRTFFAEDKNNYQSHGYSAAYFIDWLSKETSNKKIVDLLKKQKSGAENPRAIFDSFLSENKLEFFRPSDIWREYMFDLLKSKVDSRVDGNKIFLFESRRHKFAQWKSEEIQNKKLEKGDEKEDGDTREVYNYGLSVMGVEVAANLIEKMKTNPALCIITSQETEGLRTWVCNEKFEKIGWTAKDTVSHIHVGDKGLFEGDKRVFALVTEKKVQDSSPAMIMSKITAEIKPYVRSIQFYREKGREYYGGYWNISDKIDVKIKSSSAYSVTADNGKETISFDITVRNAMFTDISNVVFRSFNNSAANTSVGALKLESSNLDGSSKWALWKTNHQGNDYSLTCNFN